MNVQSVKMLCRPQDENENQVEINFNKNRKVNRRFQWTRRSYVYEIGFYCMSLMAITFLLILVYIFVDRTVKDRKCPTVTILKGKEPTGPDSKRTYPDESDPLFALCGPCPRVTCPRCVVPECNCTTWPTSRGPEDDDQQEEDDPCPTISLSSITCPPCPTISLNEACSSFSSPSPVPSEMPTFAYTEEYRTEHLCLTRNCVIEASNILKVLDEDPLNCGNFSNSICFKRASSREAQKLPSDGFDWLENDLNPGPFAVLKEIISTQSKGRPILKEIANFYTSCLDDYTIERRGHEPLKDLIKAIGGWPVLQQGDECGKNFNLTDVLARMHNLGALDSSLFLIELNLTRNSSSDPVISISFPTLGMKSLRNYQTKSWGSYYELMIDTALRLGASKQSALRSMNEALEFENKISEIIANYSEKAPKSSWQTVSIVQMNSIFSNIEWTKFLRSFENINVTGHENVNVISIDFLRHTNSLITKTERRILCNYMIWRVILDCMPRLARYWRNLYWNAMKINETRSHREICDHQVMHFFHNVLPLLYYREHLASFEMIEFRKMVQKTIEITSTVLGDYLNKASETFSQSFDRLRSFRSYIDGIHKFLRTDLVEKIYEKLELKEDEYFLNMLELAKFGRKSQLEAFRNKDPSIIHYLGPGVGQQGESRFYANHLLVILAMISSKPYLTDLDFLNYSSVGFRMVYQILYLLFRPTSIGSDSNVDSSKMEAIGLPEVNVTSNCSLADLYSDKNVPKDGRTLTLNYLAISITEKAFLSDEKPSESAHHLPGLNYDSNQLFFINLANTFCSDSLYRIQEKRPDLVNGTSRRFDAIVSEVKSFRKFFRCTDEEGSSCFAT